METLQYVDVRDASLPSERFYEILTSFLPERNDSSSTKINQKELINEIVGALKEYHRISKSKYRGESGRVLDVGNISLFISIVYPHIPLPLPDLKTITSSKARPLINWGELSASVGKIVEHPPSSSCEISAYITFYKDSPLAKDKKKELQSMQWTIFGKEYSRFFSAHVSSIFERNWKADHGIELSSTLMENIAKDLIAANEVFMGKNSKIEVVLSSIKE